MNKVFIAIEILFLTLVVHKAIAGSTDTNCSQYLKDHHLEDNSKLLPEYQNTISRVNEFMEKNITGDPTCIGNLNLNNCMGFQAYCIENLAAGRLKEDFKKWEAIVENCSDSNYLKQNSHLCRVNTVANLKRIRSEAGLLGLAQDKKSLEGATFFNQATSEFQKFANRNAALLEKKKSEYQYQKNLAETKKFMNKCSQIVAHDGNDVKGRNLCSPLNQSLGVCNQVTSESELIQSSKQLDQMDEVLRSQEIVIQVESLALMKSSQALWATSLMNFGGWNPNAVTGEVFALDLICKSGPALCTDITKKNLIKASFLEFKKKFNQHPIKKLEVTDKESFLNSELKPQIQKINVTCANIFKQSKDLKAKYSCQSIPEFKMVNGKLQVVPTPEKDKMTMDKCEGLQAQWYEDAKILQAKSASELTTQNHELLSGHLGHLFITDEFRKNVGELGPDFTYKHCMEGAGGGNGMIYKTPNSIQLNSGLNQFYQLNVNEIKKIADEFSSGKTPKENKKILQQYLKTNPLTISDLLLENPKPEYAKTLCQLIRDINRQDKLHQVGENVVAGTGFVASIALGATGIGAPAAPYLMALVTASTAGGLLFAEVNYFEASKQSNFVKQSSSTNQMELETAFNELRKYDKEKSAAIEYIIVTLSAEILGAKLGKVIKAVSGLKNSSDMLKWVRGLTYAGEWTSKELKLISTGLQKFRAPFFLLGMKQENLPKLTDNLSQAELLELGSIYSNLPDSEAETLTRVLANHTNASTIKKFISNVSSNPEKFIKSGKPDLVLLEIEAKSVGNLSLPNGEKLAPFFKQIDEMIAKVNRLK